MKKIIDLDQNDFNGLHDRIYNVFDISLANVELNTLLPLVPDWDGICDTLGLDQFTDGICLHFINLRSPINGDTEEYKETFYKKVTEAKVEVLKYINEKMIYKL